MLIVETIAKIRRAHFIDGKSIKQICRELQLSRNTVRKVTRTSSRFKRRISASLEVSPEAAFESFFFQA